MQLWLPASSRDERREYAKAHDVTSTERARSEAPKWSSPGSRERYVDVVNSAVRGPSPRMRSGVRSLPTSRPSHNALMPRSTKPGARGSPALLDDVLKGPTTARQRHRTDSPSSAPGCPTTRSGSHTEQPIYGMPRSVGSPLSRNLLRSDSGSALVSH